MLNVLILKRKYIVTGQPTRPVYTFLINGRPCGIYDTDLTRMEAQIRHVAPSARISHDWTQTPANRWVDRRPHLRGQSDR